MAKAIQVSETGDISVLKYTTVPMPTIKPTQLLVKNHYAGINFIDTYHRTGLYKLPLPFIPGREASGVVEQVGEQVTGFKVGDRVAYTGSGTYAEYTAAERSNIIKIPDNVSFELGAAVLLQGLTAVALTRMMHPVQPGQTVLIHAAAGGTGQVLVQLCKLYGATVIGTVSTKAKKELALKAGAHHVIIYTETEIAPKVLELTNGQGVDAVFDGVGKTTFDTSLACLKTLGSLVSFGNASGKVDPIDIMKLVPKCVRLSRPSLFNLIKTQEDFTKYATELFDLISKGKLDISVSKVYDIEEIGQAHTDLETQKTTGKIVIKCFK
ncbi:NADPH:quinone reductase [Boothiomyces sp. JEL0838]|nr:NADPH:quinone reductase [Boothiomyces sp. JEL0838]